MTSLFGLVAVGLVACVLRAIVSSTRPREEHEPRFLTVREAPEYEYPEGRWVEVPEASKLLGVSRRTIYRMISDGRLAEKEKNGRKAVDRIDLLRFKSTRK